MKLAYLQNTYRALAAALSLVALWQCNIEVGNPDSNLPESVRPMQNLSFNLAVGGTCTTTADACTSVPVTAPDASFQNISYEMTAVNFQLSGLQLKPLAETSVWTQLDLLRGSSVTLSESTESPAVTAIALKFQAPQSPGGRTFEIDGNLVLRAGDARIVLPLKIEFDSPLLAETIVATPGAVPDGVEFNASTWFDFSDAKADFSHILKALTSGACRAQDSAACAGYRETIARQISRRISRSMSVRSHPVGKTNQQTKKTP